MNLTGWSKSLEITADGEGIVSHAGLALLRQLADKTGLTGGLSRALASMIQGAGGVCYQGPGKVVFMQPEAGLVSASGRGRDGGWRRRCSCGHPGAGC